MHLLPLLRRLEEKYKNELVVIGVHSAKFLQEQATQNMRQAVLRYRIKHPVVNDKEFIIWQSYGCRAWPTLMFIDPLGKVTGKHEGELPFEVMDKLVADMIADYDHAGILDRRPPEFIQTQETTSTLYFPGKVIAHQSTERLFIADSGHNRIVVSSLDGKLQLVVGSGNASLRDGSLEQAQFNNPQGMALWGNVLYVADTDNHAIRRIDLAKGKVTTVAGSARQGAHIQAGGSARLMDMRSPWDLALWNNILYIAMAGMHQLWALDLITKELRAHAGTGHEAIVDGGLAQAALAQPSGITCIDGRLYFVDSETSSVRWADTDPNGRVGTIAGRGLFDFGDMDGWGDLVRLQHPLGICAYEDVIYIADTYNNKVKRVLPSSRSVQTIAGTGKPGLQDGPGASAMFYEPGGLEVATDQVFIADTNNHAIRIIDLASGNVSTLQLTGS